MIISIGGTPGSGKSTLAKMLAAKLDYRRYYMGGIRREMAQRRGMTLSDLNKLGEIEPWTDAEVDEFQKGLGAAEDNFVIEGRTSFLMIPHSLKIFITVDPHIGAERVFRDLQKPQNNRNEDAQLASVYDVYASHERRMASDRIRYHKYYSIDVYDPKHYDFTLDTTNLNPGQCFEKLYSFVASKLLKK